MNRTLVFLLCCVLVSCETSKKVVYMQDSRSKEFDIIKVNQGIKIQHKDILSIVVSSKNPELAMAYNLPMSTYQTGSTNVASYSQRLLGYHVDLNGNIDFPGLGILNVAGKTREEVSNYIKQELVRKNIINDAIVVIEFMNFKISVLGEVRYPTTNSLDNDKITLLEALGRAGDLTIYGRRDNILVYREQNDTVYYLRVNLLKTDFIHSPAYYLQQNDVVYVEPNYTAAERSGINENRSVGILLNLASLLITLGVLFFK